MYTHTYTFVYIKRTSVKNLYTCLRILSGLNQTVYVCVSVCVCVFGLMCNQYVYVYKTLLFHYLNACIATAARFCYQMMSNVSADKHAQFDNQNDMCSSAEVITGQ